MSGIKKRKTALITGASGGIGSAIAHRLSTDGFYLCLVSRTALSLEKLLQEIQAAGGEGRVLTCDVTSQKSVNSMMENIESIDVLVNCAGRGGGGHTAKMDDQLWHDIIAVNLNSVYYLTKAALSQQKINKPGAIINIASTGGKQGVIYASAYTASKHGVVGFSKSLGLELAKEDITVNAVCPGFVETPLAEHARQVYGKIWNITPEEAKTRIEQRIPIGRYIEPEEVANFVAYLASPAARGITAQAINICGGLGNY
jgi:ketoreductase